MKKFLRFWERKLFAFYPTSYLCYFLLQRYSSHLYQEFAKLVSSLVIKGKVLDIGTGYGLLPMELVKVCKGIQIIVGIDISFSSLKIAKKRLKEKLSIDIVKFTRTDAHQLNFQDNTFDCITSTGSLNLWNDPVMVINEAYRILKPGGKFLLIDQCLAKSVKELKNAFLKYKYFGFGLPAYSIEEVNHFLKKSSFNNYSVEVKNICIFIEMEK